MSWMTARIRCVRVRTEFVERTRFDHVLLVSLLTAARAARVKILLKTWKQHARHVSSFHWSIYYTLRYSIGGTVLSWEALFRSAARACVWRGATCDCTHWGTQVTPCGCCAVKNTNVAILDRLLDPVRCRRDVARSRSRDPAPKQNVDQSEDRKWRTITFKLNQSLLLLLCIGTRCYQMLSYSKDLPGSEKFLSEAKRQTWNVEHEVWTDQTGREGGGG